MDDKNESEYNFPLVRNYLRWQDSRGILTDRHKLFSEETKKGSERDSQNGKGEW